MSNNNFAGRALETGILRDLLKSASSEMVAVIGRRRVGKTHLVRQVYTPYTCFEVTGIQHAPVSGQLENFTNKLREFFRLPKSAVPPATWLQAFNLLKGLLQKNKSKKKRVIFIDELPWMATAKSGFLEALGHFWNDWASHNNIIIVICGSAASWMITNVVHHRGSLHNRITQLIRLQPFTLGETEIFLQKNNIFLNRQQIVLLYMVTGGIPHYLKEIRKGQSMAQNIDRICFAAQGLLKDEFDKLYYSLYDKPENHIAIVRALAGTWKGLPRKELVKIAGFADGGSITRVLNELEQSDFINSYQPFDKKKKDMLYRLTDHYSLFYLGFIEGKRKSGAGTFINLAKVQAWKSWCGYAFENICFYHLPQLKAALGVAAVYTEVSGYLLSGTKSRKGIQVDMLIDRADGVINLCEMKFYDAPFTITKEYAANLRTRRAVFREETGTRKTVFITMITCFGLNKNMYADELVQSEVLLDDLFKSV
jgi:uncharacterized protein